jgi:DNA gyrase subunit B
VKEEKPKYTADKIQALEGVEHVRLRPEMYFEKVYTEKSLDRLPLETACHAFDELLDNNCSFLKITIYADQYAIEYDAGMSLRPVHPSDPMTVAEAYMTKIAACRNYKKHLAVGDEFCEMGITAVNAAAEWCTLLTYSNGQKGEFRFEIGRTKTATVTESTEHESYTKITVKPDPIIFPDLSFNTTTLQQKIDKVREKLNGFNIQLVIEK